MNGPTGRRSLPLRSRLALTFALVTLSASLLVSATTFFLAKRYLIEQRERSAIRQTFLNTRLVRDLLQAAKQEPEAVLDGTVGEVGTLALLRVDDQWFASGVAADPSDLPQSLLESLQNGEAAHQRLRRAGQPRLLIGVPLPALDAEYLEIVPMNAVERTLRTLVASLVAGSIATTLAGTLVGAFVSRRVLRPVQRVSSVAAEITAGDHTARLDAGSDPDLAPLVSSFNTMLDALQAKIDREQRFASDVSHELRTPLTVLKAAIELVEQRSDDMPQRSREAIILLARQIEYFERLVLDLLEISRFDSGVEKPELEEVNVVEMVETVSKQLGGPAVMTTGNGAVHAEMDRRRIERIIGNLLENAARYAGGATAIRVDAFPHAVRIMVSDRGNGIPVEEREHIFERFWRGREARHQASKGSGLGLALVAEHVRVLGGFVEVGENPGGGATFAIHLPREAPT